MSTTKQIADLKSLGPKSQQMLEMAGIHTVEQLLSMGAVAAYVQVKAASPRASLNLLWALESAVTGVPWQVIAKKERTSLLLAVEDAERGHR